MSANSGFAHRSTANAHTRVRQFSGEQSCRRDRGRTRRAGRSALAALAGFLSDDIRAVVDLDAVHLDADRYTFHPDLPGLAFVGMWDQSGGYFVPLELQARWIAYTWGGAIPAPDETIQRLAVGAYRSQRGMSQKTRMNLVALTFARAAGVEPDLRNWPHIRRALLFGPLAPSCFRLEGPDALPDAAIRFERAAAAFGAITSNELTKRESRYWSLVEAGLSG